MSTHEHGHPDDWFAHSLEEGLPQPEHAGHVNTRALMIFYMAMLAFVVVAVVGVTLFFKRSVLEMRQSRLETLVLAQEANAYKAQTLEALRSYGSAEPIVPGSVRIPLSQARQEVLRAYGQPPADGS